MKLKAISATVLSAIMATTAMVPFSAFADQQPSVEYTGGNGDPITHLYLIADDSELANNHDADWNKVNAKVEVPVAIHYVAQADGTIAGPSDNLAQIRNFSGFPVNVSNIKVTAETGVTFVSTPEAADTADEIYLQMKPNSGTVLALGDYTPSATETTAGSGNGLGKRPTAGAEWNIAAAVSGVGTSAAQASILNLNALSGKIGGFNTLNPAADTEIGQITWTVKPGTFGSYVDLPTASTFAATSLTTLSKIGDYLRTGNADSTYVNAAKALVGNTVDITLKDNTVMTARLVSVDGSENGRGLTFEPVNCLPTTAYMNQNSAAGIGWDQSDMRASLNGGILYNTYFEGTALDQVVHPVTNYSYDYSQNVNGVGGNVSVGDRYWVPSANNIYGPNWPQTYNGGDPHSDGELDTQFDYYAGVTPKPDPERSPIAGDVYLTKGQGWYLRSAYPMDARQFEMISTNGAFGSWNSSGVASGVVSCFCL